LAGGESEGGGGKGKGKGKGAWNQDRESHGIGLLDQTADPMEQ
jgi:hypothetical protein